MFEFKAIVTHPIYYLNYIMPCLITTQIRLDIKQTTIQKTTKKISKNKNFTAKTEYQNLKAHSNNVKMQSDKTLTTQIQITLLYSERKVFLMRLCYKSTMKTINEAKLKK